MNDSSRTYIGDNIRMHRIRKGISQEYVANKLGKTQNWLSKMENGSIRIDEKIMSDIDNILEVSSEELITSGSSNFFINTMLAFDNFISRKRAHTLCVLFLFSATFFSMAQDSKPLIKMSCDSYEYEVYAHKRDTTFSVFYDVAQEKIGISYQTKLDTMKRTLFMHDLENNIFYHQRMKKLIVSNTSFLLLAGSKVLILSSTAVKIISKEDDVERAIYDVILRNDGGFYIIAMSTQAKMTSVKAIEYDHFGEKLNVQEIDPTMHSFLFLRPSKYFNYHPVLKRLVYINPTDYTLRCCINNAGDSIIRHLDLLFDANPSIFKKAINDKKSDRKVAALMSLLVNPPNDILDELYIAESGKIFIIYSSKSRDTGLTRRILTFDNTSTPTYYELDKRFKLHDHFFIENNLMFALKKTNLIVEIRPFHLFTSPLN